MSKGVNKVILVGHVGKDPETRASQKGMIMATFSFATADRQKDQTGQWVDKTEWHNIVAFQRTAEIVRDHVKKGSQLYLEGKIQTRSWDDKESGQKKYRTEILVNDLGLLGGAPKENGKASPPGRTERSSGTSDDSYYTGGNDRPEKDYGGLGITDDDIPF